MANVWFMADVHGGHKNLVNWRTQFKTEEEHWEYVKERYHKVVTKRDVIYFHGDICFSMERLEDLAKWTGEKKVLIAGNHCTEHIHMRDLVRVFDDVHALMKYKEFWLSHAPIHSSELRGKLNIHGHTHNVLVDDPRYINVCLEQTEFSPISLMEIRNIVNNRRKWGILNDK